jgi:hypothetical protein
MAQPSLLNRLVASLFGGGQPTLDDAAERQLIAEAIEAVVDTVEPRVRHRSGYAAKLEPCVRKVIAHLRAIAREPLEPVLMARAAWHDDPRLNAFFATADDVPACLGRSRELRAFFEDPANAEVQEAYALLGMKKEERTVFAPQFEGDTLKGDVAQVTVSFSGHRVVAPTATQAASRLEVGRRIIQRFGQVALSRIIALDNKATELQQHKAYLGARLRLLNLARDGMEGIVSDPATIGEQIKTVERELKEAVDDYIETKASLATLDGYIQQIDDVFSHPEQHLTLTHTPLRLTRMGFKADAAATGPVNELILTELSVGENLRAAIAVVRCPRSELPPKEDLVAKAERYL